ncbi:transcriptional regulator, AsnC family [Mitsuaria sp. PDC51]|jgi:Lrp/AsnC family leucine-responsive transcriptional regulator|uniref:Lrp/AsnC family transcriptional regulator n=1 Tax=unclassified Roseateles TaxID=2626991 RepID=UPI0008E7A528|nr:MULTISPECIES: Lrp/AsnC family transcriptional regulator [unclassified Roseateles]MBB3283867.1 Lrp/AsnC family leucine-responsive transcriptional regulator [Mitsuaria sp. BK037]MBB3295909.1 Lrp/AsnC family leucine-responsive transcriptional regulator [Mitsuaria sp. BK041]MBB3365124.1 Lrp/AsnC family leucine-responsive transcriptional regulator [Mitsuaria sp. BK045]SFR94279.1 transcriptional regulator, AsnC family [Mitsuaria sp. PDC51]
MDQQIKLDKFDRAILRALQRNARASLQEVSEEVGLTTSPCWTRIKRLEESGVIEGYTVKVNAEKIGRPEQLIVQLTLNKHTDAAMAEFARHLEAIPEVIDAYLVSGDYDYVLRLSVRDTRDYERLLREKLYKIPGVRHSKSSFVLRCLKASSLPL